MAMQKRAVVTGSGITINLLDNEDFIGKPDAFTLVHSVKWEGGEWVWDKENYPNQTRGQFYQSDDGKCYILIVNASQIVDVYDIDKMKNYILIAKTDAGPKYDGRGDNVKSRVVLKKTIASHLGMKFKLQNNAEKMAHDNIREEALRKADEARALEEAKREETRAKNAHQKSVILARPRMKGYSMPGDRYFNGTPVVGDEWLKMDGGSYCVAVESYNDETKTHGNISNCFIVGQDGARKKQMHVSEFTFKKSSEKAIVTSIGELTWRDADTEFFTANVYRNAEDVQVLRKAGLNSSTLVAVPAEVPNAWQIIKVSKAGLLYEKPLVTTKNGVFDPI